MALCCWACTNQRMCGRCMYSVVIRGLKTKASRHKGTGCALKLHCNVGKRIFAPGRNPVPTHVELNVAAFVLLNFGAGKRQPFDGGCVLCINNIHADLCYPTKTDPCSSSRAPSGPPGVNLPPTM